MTLVEACNTRFCRRYVMTPLLLLLLPFIVGAVAVFRVCVFVPGAFKAGLDQIYTEQWNYHDAKTTTDTTRT